MLPQQELINRLRDLCQTDERIVAATLYGSFAMGEADKNSDIECVLFIDSSALPSFDKRGWIDQIAPTLAFFKDDFGHYTAIFDSLIRGEFHFDPAESIPNAATWQGNAWFPSAEHAVVIDRTGALHTAMQPLFGPPPERDNAETVERFIYNFANIVLFGLNTLERGELARTLELLGGLHRLLLWMARLVEGSIAHWPTPSRNIEAEISGQAYKRLAECTARLDRGDLARAYRATWTWGSEMIRALAARHQIAVPETLFARITQTYFPDGDSAH